MIAYHGTNKEAAESIKLTGFRQGTYFAYHKEDAIEFGGKYVFEVEFSDDPVRWRGEPDGWQFFLRDPLGVEHIKNFEVIEG